MQIKRMTINDVDEVYEIEKESFYTPWDKNELLKEVDNNPVAKYLIACNDDDNIMGYIGMWHVIDEGHITNVAVKQEFRSIGVGYFLVQELIKLAMFYKIKALTLEVNINNIKAQRLYSKCGFVVEGIRKNYYKPLNEDAVIMWKYF